MQIIHMIKIFFELLFVHETFPHKYANIMLRKSGHFIIQIEQMFQSFRTAIKHMNQQWWVCETDVTANSVNNNGWLARYLCLSATGSEHEEINKCTQKNSQTFLWIYIWVTLYKNISQCKHKFKIIAACLLWTRAFVCVPLETPLTQTNSFKFIFRV